MLYYSLLLLLALSHLLLQTHSSTIYVKYHTNCDGSGDGTLTTPYCNINDAFSQLKSIISSDSAVIISLMTSDTRPSENEGFNQFWIDSIDLAVSNLSLTISNYNSSFDEITDVFDLSYCNMLPTLVFDLRPGDGKTSEPHTYAFDGFYSIGFQNVKILIKDNGYNDTASNMRCSGFSNRVDFGSRLTYFELQNSCVSSSYDLINDSVPNESREVYQAMVVRELTTLKIENVIMDEMFCNGFEFGGVLSNASISQVKIYVPPTIWDDINLDSSQKYAPAIFSITGGSDSAALNITGVTFLVSTTEITSEFFSSGFLREGLYNLYPVLTASAFLEISVSNVEMNGTAIAFDSSNVFSFGRSKSVSLSNIFVHDMTINHWESTVTPLKFFELTSVKEVTITSMTVQSTVINWQSTMFTNFVFLYINVINDSQDAPVRGHVIFSDMNFTSNSFLGIRDHFWLIQIETSGETSENPIDSLVVENLRFETIVSNGTSLFEYNPLIQANVNGLSGEMQKTHNFKNVVVSDCTLNNTIVFAFKFGSARAVPPPIEPERIEFKEFQFLNNFISYGTNYDSAGWLAAIQNEGYVLSITNLNMKHNALNWTHFILARYGKVSTYIRYSTFENNRYNTGFLLSERLDTAIWDSMMNMESGEQTLPQGLISQSDGNTKALDGIGNPLKRFTLSRLSRVTYIIYSTFSDEILIGRSVYMEITNPLSIIVSNVFRRITVQEKSVLLQLGNYDFVAQGTHMQSGTRDTDSYLYQYETDDTFDQLQKRIEDTCLGTGAITCFVSYYHQYRIEANNFTDCIVETPKFISVEDFGIVTSGVLFENNIFQNFSLLEGANLRLLSFTIVSRVDIRWNLFSGFKGEGLLLYFTEFRGELRANITRNVFTDLQQVGVIQFSLEEATYLRILENNFTDSTLSQSLLRIYIFTAQSKVQVFGNIIMNVTLVTSEAVDLPTNLFAIKLCAVGNLVNPAVIIKNNTITNTSMQLSREYAEDTAFISVSSSLTWVTFYNNTLSGINISPRDPLINIIGLSIDLTNNNFENLDCTGVFGAVILISLNTYIAENSFLMISNRLESEGFLRIFPALSSDANSIAKVEVVSNNFKSIFSQSGSILLLQNALSALNFDSNIFIDCYVRGKSSILFFSSVQFALFQMRESVIDYTDAGPEDMLANFLTFLNASQLIDPEIRDGLSLLSADIGVRQLSIAKKISGCFLSAENSVLQFNIAQLSINSPAANTQLESNFTLIKAKSNSSSTPSVIFANAITVKNIILEAPNLFEFDGVYAIIQGSSFFNLNLSTGTSLIRILKSYALNSSTIINECEFDSISGEGQEAAVIHLSQSNTANSSSSSIRRLAEARHLQDSAFSFDVVSDPVISPKPSAILVNSSSFSSLSFEKGSALLLEDQTNSSTVYLRYCKFHDTTASDRGGAIWSNTTDLDISHTAFGTAEAQNGGIYIYTEQKSAIEVRNTSTVMLPKLEDSIVYGPNLLEFSIVTLDSEVVYQKLQNNSTTGLDHNRALTDGSVTYAFIIQNVTSHSLGEIKMRVNLAFESGTNQSKEVFDETTGILKFKFYLGLNSEPLIYTSDNCTKGVCEVYIPGMQIYGNGGEQRPAVLSYQSERFTQETWFLVQFRNCVSGEIHNPIRQTCEYCLDDFYERDQTCYACPEGAFCSKGRIVSVMSGFWRKDLQSTQVLSCNYTASGRCLGENVCGEGYEGIMCKQCDNKKGFLSAEGDEYTCSECASTPDRLWVLGILSITGTLLFQLYSVRSFGKENESLLKEGFGSVKPSPAPYIRLATHFGQLISIVLTLNLDAFSYIGFINAVGSPSKLVFYSLDCLILRSGRDAFGVMVIKVLYYLLSPVIKFLIVGIVSLVIYIRLKWKKQNESKALKYIGLVAVVLIVNEQPNIVEILTSYLTCEELDPYSGQSWIRSNLNVSCGTDSYRNFMWGIIIPGILIWIIALPVLLIYILVKNKNKLKESKLLVSTMGLVYCDYDDRKYYWGIVTVILKSVIYVASALLSGNSLIKGLTLFAIFSVYLVVLSIGNPYRDQKIHEIEAWCIKVYLVALFLILYAQTAGLWVQIICLVLFCIVIISMLAFLAWKMLQFYFQKVKEVVVKRKALKKLDTNINFNSDGGLSPIALDIDTPGLNNFENGIAYGLELSAVGSLNRESQPLAASKFSPESTMIKVPSEDRESRMKAYLENEEVEIEERGEEEGEERNENENWKGNEKVKWRRERPERLESENIEVAKIELSRKRSQP